MDDLDGDGHPDIAVANNVSDNVSVLLGNGDGTFGETANYGSDIEPRCVIVCDLDGDTAGDLAIANARGRVVSVLLNLTPATSPVEGSAVAALAGPCAVVLRWTLEPSSGVEGINIYRSTSPEGPFSRVNAAVVPPSSPGSYEDTTVWPGTTFWYEVRAVLPGGSEDVLGQQPAPVTTPGSLAVSLYAASPNPFAGETSVVFDVVDHVGPVSLKVYNVRGELVRSLLGGPVERGRHVASWDGLDGRGHEASSGVYFFRLQAGDESRVRKALLLR